MLAISFLRSLLMAVVYPFFLVFISALAALSNFVFNSRKIDNKFVEIWGNLSCAMFGVKVNVTGLENVPRNVGAIFLFNHTSFFDIFSMTAALPHLRFGAKIELFNIPMFGLAMRRFGGLPIAREKRHEVIKVYDQAVSRLHAGEQFALAPEGTRQSDEKLGAFKAGPFIFAIKAQVPLVPVVIKNAQSVLPKGKFLPNLNVWRSEIELHILPPIQTVGFSLDQRELLQKQVREKMEAYF